MKSHQINDVVERALTIATMSGLPPGVTVEKELRDDLPPVMVDGEQIVQVLLNMVSNAFEAMPEGGKLTIKTRKITTDTGAAVGISLRDTGQGIPKETLKQIFKPFFYHKRTRRWAGFGYLPTDHPESRWRDPRQVHPGQGSIFHIYLNPTFPKEGTK